LSFYTGGIDSKRPITKAVNEHYLTRSFIINVSIEGEYYLNTHIMASREADGESFQEVCVYVNEKFAGSLDIQTDTWAFVAIKNHTPIRLKQGINQITFSSLPPNYPEIDVIQVTSNPDSFLTKDDTYNDYIDYLRQHKSTIVEKKSQNEIDSSARYLNDRNETKSAYDDSGDWQVTPFELSNPGGNYQHKMCVPITYTYHRKMSLSQGTYTFMTGPVDGDDFYTVDPVMYLYKIDDPHQHSYYNDDYSSRGFHSQINATLPSGDYYLVVRAFSSSFSTSALGRQGLINVYKNGVLLNSQCPVAGYRVDVDSPNTGGINYFTAYSTGIPCIFLEEKGSNKLRFNSDSYFYIPPMDYSWIDDARMRLTKYSSDDRYRMLISCAGAFGAYYGNCDVYGSCQQVIQGDQIANSFTNLMPNDGIYSSASIDDTYNCASWAGGVTYGWTWGAIYAGQSNGALVGPSYGQPTVWDSWDDFFGNNPQRYAGATVYTREYADPDNAEIAVWSNNGAISGVTHFSCRGTANGHPHGYAWESKPGSLRRIFHPKNALSGNAYGSIFAYYRDANKAIAGFDDRLHFRTADNTSISLDESIKRGLTVIEKINLSEEEKRFYDSSVTKALRTDSMSTLYELYDNWTKSVQSENYRLISNPYVLLSTPEGKDLVAYGKKHETEALSFFIDLFFEDENQKYSNELSYYMFCSIFSEYADIIEDVKKEWRGSPKDRNGAYIAPTPEMFSKKYAKNLMHKLYKF
jgi:hypothetical protein